MNGLYGKIFRDLIEEENEDKEEQDDHVQITSSA
jgi:hypothetical protein